MTCILKMHGDERYRIATWDAELLSKYGLHRRLRRGGARLLVASAAAAASIVGLSQVARCRCATTYVTLYVTTYTKEVGTLALLSLQRSNIRGCSDGGYAVLS